MNEISEDFDGAVTSWDAVNGRAKSSWTLFDELTSRRWRRFSANSAILLKARPGGLSRRLSSMS